MAFLAGLVLSALLGMTHCMSLPGGFSDGDLDEHPYSPLMKSLATNAIEVILKSNQGLWSAEGCRLETLSASNYQSQVVAGTVHQFDVEVQYNENCGPVSGERSRCNEIKVFEDLDCVDRHNCFSVIDKDDIVCFSTEIIEFDDGCPGCLSEADLNDERVARELKTIAVDKAGDFLKSVKGWWPTANEEDCNVNLLDVSLYKQQVVAGTMHEFDADFKYNKHCGDHAGKSVRCSSFRIWQKLPFECTSGICLELQPEDLVDCEVIGFGASNQDSGFGCPGCESAGQIEDEKDADMLKTLAEDAVENQLRLTSSPGDEMDCALNLVEVSNYRNQVVAGFFHKFAGEFRWSQNCEASYAKEKVCAEIEILEPLSGTQFKIEGVKVNSFC